MPKKNGGGKEIITLKQKAATLCLLVVQIVATVTVMRYSRISSSSDGGKPYLSSSVVVLAEYLKVIIATFLVTRDTGSWVIAKKEIYQEVVVKSRETFKMAVPATLYAVQNNLLFIALSHLDSAVYQIVYQIKTLTTAMFAVFILRKQISKWQWFSLVLLAIGVAIVQLGVHSKSSVIESTQGGRGGGGEEEQLNNNDDTSSSSIQEQNPLKGICAILLACVSSGFAGIYFEKVLKQTKQSVWIRNIQLGLFGGGASILTMLIKDWSDLQELGFFHGYTPVVILVICLQASTGLIVAMVVKYTDNIVKAFAGALAIIGASMTSIYVFSFEADRNFVFGGILVVIASYIYGTRGPKKHTK
mmetsp:Transcript_34549/g.55601  ORF Transcript_34549/g.55601 Transcript_34549/m.55601 type:complete len:359 (+) Transcript_34549:19-1095(+)